MISSRFWFMAVHGIPTFLQRRFEILMLKTSNKKLDFNFIKNIKQRLQRTTRQCLETKSKNILKYFHRGKHSTRNTNSRNLKKFCNWARKSPQQLIDAYEKAKAKNDLDAWERDRINEILEFYNWIRVQINPRSGKKYTINYCNTTASSILAFHHQNTRALEGVMDSFAPTQMPTDEYRFTPDDLRKMFYYGDTEEKALISLAVSYGQGSKDFLKLECQTLASRSFGSEYLHLPQTPSILSMHRCNSTG